MCEVTSCTLIVEMLLLEVLQELLKSDANPDDQDLHGLTPFAVAAIANRWEARAP